MLGTGRLGKDTPGTDGRLGNVGRSGNGNARLGNAGIGMLGIGTLGKSIAQFEAMPPPYVFDIFTPVAKPLPGTTGGATVGLVGVPGTVDA